MGVARANIPARAPMPGLWSVLAILPAVTCDPQNRARLAFSQGL